MKNEKTVKRLQMTINKVSKIFAMASTAFVIVLMWLGWVGITPVYFGIFIYTTFLGIFHILSMAFSTNDRARLRRAMKADKERFVVFVKTRYIIKTVSDALTAVEDIKTYCKKNGVSEDDAVIKSALDSFVKILQSSLTKKKEGGNGYEKQENATGQIKSYASYHELTAFLRQETIPYLENIIAHSKENEEIIVFQFQHTKVNAVSWELNEAIQGLLCYLGEKEKLE